MLSKTACKSFPKLLVFSRFALSGKPDETTKTKENEMASRKQVETKAAKLGGKLIANRDNATLISPAGFHWDGYHSQVDYFDDGRQETWDYFWLAINKQEPCDCESTTKNSKEPKEPKELTRSYCGCYLCRAQAEMAEADDASSIDQLITELKTTRKQKEKAGA